MAPSVVSNDLPPSPVQHVVDVAAPPCPDEAPGPVAIVGLGMRLPGGIHNAKDFWKVLVEKRSTRCEIPSTRFNVDGFHSAMGKAGSVAMRHGHFLAESESDSFRHFDSSFFSMGMKEVEDVDPQQRMLLEVVYECMQTSGEPNWRGGNIGCFVGVWGEDWLDLRAKDAQDAGLYQVAGGHDFAISNRISYEYDLKGPSFTIKAGCSSSMLALHEAVRAIRAGDCTGAIVAGTNLIFTPTMSIAMSEQGVLSPDGSCKTFDAAANGYARGEAINAIYLKPLDQALKNGEPVRAVIRGTASNCDGKTPGMSMPSSEGHEALIRRAYQEAGLDPSQTLYVEAHGTGTPVGDPLEATAIARVFGAGEGRTFYIGSVKPNLGHSEGASGISSILKAVLALEHKAIPPNINFSTPNPKIPFREANMAVPVEVIPWPETQPLRASVNSFGIGGANGHCIIESVESYLGQRDRKMLRYPMHPNNGNSTISDERSLLEDVDFGVHSTQTTRPRKVLHVLSAASAASLKRSIVDHDNYIQTHPLKTADVSHNLCCRREHLSNRAYCVADNPLYLDEDVPPLQFSALTKKKTAAPTVNMVFTGQGAQWAGMAKELLDDYATFRRDIAALGGVLKRLEHPPAWDLVEELYKPEAESNLNRVEFSQPLVCAVQIALVNLLGRLGIRPHSVVGHSSGEIAAAYAAGAISSEEAITIAYYRGYVTRGYHRPGGMAAIGLGPEKVSQYLVKGVVVACQNSSDSVTLSGDKEPLEKVCDDIKRENPDCLVRLLRVEMAYHSHHMLDIGGTLESLLRNKVNSKSCTAPVFSTVKVKPLQAAGSFDAAYWRENFESPVRFSSAVKLLLDIQSSVEHLFIEIGPHSALAGPLRQILRACGRNKDGYVTALTRGRDCTDSVLRMAGDMFLQGLPINLSGLSPTGRVLTDLPRYSWQHDREYWKEGRLSRNWRFRSFPHHELLGSRTLESSDLNPQWRNILRLEDVPWLVDHQVLSDIVFPCAGYLGMAGEAIRQVFGGDDLTLRNVVIHTALVLSESKSVEMVTSLRPGRLTNTLDSVWWEFSVVSHNGSNWIKHCEGQVRSGGAGEDKSITPSHPHPRVVGDVYPALKRAGLNYGPCFNGLEYVTCLPNGKMASAVLSTTTVSESEYHVHPTTIDHCLQLFFAANCEGLFHRAEKLCVPTEIEELYLAGGKNCAGSIVEATAATSSSGAICGSATAATKDECAVFFSLKGVRLSPLDTSIEDDNNDRAAAARLDWKPHLDFSDMHSLIHPSESSRDDGKDLDLVEKLTLLAIIELEERIGNCEIDNNMQNFCSWIQTQASLAAKGNYRGLVPRAQDLLLLTRDQRLALISELQSSLLNTRAAISAVLVGRILDRCEDIVRGNVQGIEILQANEGLAECYNWIGSRSDVVDFFTVAGHTQPTLRILEIGAGTGGSTAVALEGLNQRGAVESMYYTYVYSDISAGFFPAARERFKAYPRLNFKVLDISKEPLEQGFEAASFDIILAQNVLHATPNLQETLANVKKLLAPGGRLFLQELSPKMLIVNLIMGILPGWWLGEQDGRVGEPYVSPERWDMELKQAGFSGVDTAIYDAPSPYHMNANIISRLTQNQDISTSPTHHQIALLHHPGDENSPGILRIRDLINECGFLVELISLEQIQQQQNLVSSIHDIVSVLELEKPYFEKISASNLKSFQHIVGRLGSSRMLWITRPAQTNIGADDNPGFGLSVGLTRSLRYENSVSITTLEVDCINDGAYTAIAKLLRNFFTRDDVDKFKDKLAPAASPSSTMNLDYEFVLSNGAVKVARYHPILLAEEMMKRSSESESMTLEIRRPGLLQSLRWVPYATQEVGNDEVVIEPRCTGMNFRDILCCMGIVEATHITIGLEGSGVVVKVGTDVTELQPGDRVFYLGSNCYSTRMVISAKRCAKIPPMLSWEQAATVPCVYATVIHCLLDMGRLERGHSVLIHSACGGIGIAALNICQNISGLEIYTTVGTEAKALYLMETFGLPRERIFNSRDTSFLSDILNATSGRSVDLVLNSLSGELLHASWQCVAPFGKMIEIGKRDFIGKAQLSMDLFEANRSFIGVDLARFDATQVQPLLLRTSEMLNSGKIKPIEPIKVFNGTEIQDSFRYMQKGAHLGKIVVSIPEQGQGLPTAAKPPQMILNPQAAYLLVGGLGGLGRAVATWMVEMGARHLIFLSRSAGQRTQDRAFFHELEFQGCTTQAIQGSISDIADVERALNASPPSRPVRGILQLSMVLRDMAFADMNLTDWETAVAPKVQGTWNLHHAAPKDLDFFIATGSVSGSFGNPGQANYAAGNTFLTALMQHRRALGLPASVLHVGFMEDIGFLAQNLAQADALRATGIHFLQTRELLDAIHWAMVNSSPANSHAEQLTIGLRSQMALSDPSNRAIWRKDRRMAMYHNGGVLGGTDGTGGDDGAAALRVFMASVEADPGVLNDAASVQLVTREICTHVYIFMLRPVDEELDTSASLVSLGVDSLVTIEIRNWIKRTFGGVEFSTLEILSAGSAEGLGALVMEALRARFIDKAGAAMDEYLSMKAP